MSVDVIILLDATNNVEIAFRATKEAALLNQCGMRVGFLHTSLGSGGAILPDISSCLRSGEARLIGRGESVHARMMIVHVADKVSAAIPELQNVSASKVVLVHHAMPKLSQVAFWNMFAVGPVSWVPTNRWVRDALLRLDMPVHIESEDWRPVSEIVPRAPRFDDVTRPRFVAHISSGASEHWPKDAKTLLATHGLPDGFSGVFVGDQTEDSMRSTLQSNGWHNFKESDCSVTRLLSQIDVLLYLPDAPPNHLPDSIISAAMASARVVILPEFLRRHYGDGAFYPRDGRVTDIMQRLAPLAGQKTAETEEHRHRLDRAVRETSYYFPEKPQLDRLSRLLSKFPDDALNLERKKKRKSRKRKQCIFLTSSDVGLGHLSRSLAIARRMDSRIEPIFLTMTTNTNLINRFGFHAEYVPSQAATPTTFAYWDQWFRIELADKLERYEADLLVYDGNVPSDGIIQAGFSQTNCMMSWVRRGMYSAASTSTYIDNSKFFDLILEPGELATSMDNGLTVKRRSEVRAVDPVLLLDPNELLSRQSAQAELGLEPDKLAVLIQIGLGSNRNLPKLTANIVKHLQVLPNAQVVITEAENTATPLPPWRGVKYLDGMPISKYLNAFDFTIASAGYNTFHEVINYGVPTIFFPNDAQGMDDQTARSAFAQDIGAGFHITDADISLLPIAIKALSSQSIRIGMRQCALTNASKNGADDAATTLASLVGLK